MILGGALASMTAACASGSASSGSSAGSTRVAAAAARARSTSGRLERADFNKPEFGNMYDAVRVLRPDWLQARGGAKTFGGGAEAAVIGIFIEGRAVGYLPDKLREFVPGNVLRLHRILASEAMANYGTQWAWGGIVVTLVR